MIRRSYHTRALVPTQESKATGLFHPQGAGPNHETMLSRWRLAYPAIRVSASRPGADPFTMAATVAAPLRAPARRNSVSRRMTSTSSLGTTTRRDPSGIDHVYVAGAGGTQVPLSAV
jgi:hypothetical protein